MKKKRVVYFGSPEFSLPPLKTLYLGGYDIVGVYTQEPKKKFRGQKKYNTPVQQWAESQLLPVFTPKILDDKSLKEFQSLKPDVAILFCLWENSSTELVKHSFKWFYKYTCFASTKMERSSTYPKGDHEYG